MSTYAKPCWRSTIAVAIAGTLVACTSVPLGPPAPVSGLGATGNAITKPERARWIAVDWSQLPGWDADAVREVWPALMKSCEKPLPAWAAFCTQARSAPAADDAARAWLMQRLVPHRIEALDGASEGLATGYFEPMVDASRVARGEFRYPIHAPPADLALRKPYWSRQELDTLPQAQTALSGREIAFVAHPLDALLLQVQGSGRLRLTETDGRTRMVRVGYAGANDHPYKSVGAWLIEQGELRSGEASWPAIRDWARRNPKRVVEMLWANPRVVFFREEALPDSNAGPRGSAGVALTPGRSIAVDPASIPYGTPVWLDTSEPLTRKPLRRLVVAQDSGNAIVGAVRADYFWGWGGDAEAQAGRMKQPLRMWALWPQRL